MTTLDRYRIPRTTADPFVGDVPERSRFYSVHAHQLLPGDLYLHKGEILQVVGIRPFQGDKIDIKAAPLAGGVIVGYAVMREQYVECYQFKTTVVHCKRASYDVYIGRPSKWGNPFIIGKDGTRDEVIEKYRAWLHEPEQAHLLAAVKPELKGKRLACYCAPEACHGDVLAAIANEVSP